MACLFDAYHTVSTLSLCYRTLGSFYFYIHFINNSDLNKQTGVAPSVVFYLIIIIFTSFC